MARICDMNLEDVGWWLLLVFKTRRNQTIGWLFDWGYLRKTQFSRILSTRLNMITDHDLQKAK